MLNILISALIVSSLMGTSIYTGVLGFINFCSDHHGLNLLCASVVSFLAGVIFWIVATDADYENIRSRGYTLFIGVYVIAVLGILKFV